MLKRVSWWIGLSVLGCLRLAEAQSFCTKWPSLCTETHDYSGPYVGHDEPSLLFYSTKPGSGSSSVYYLRLPKEPPTLPKQDGAGGTYNFQLHIAYWFGMAMCDSESYPNFTKTCVPKTDANIFDDASPSSPKYIGHHPGTAFMEMQFYPPGWVKWPEGVSCDAHQWCAALNIDSISENLTTSNNLDCRNQVGEEPVNFAFITKSGFPLAPANPLVNTDAKFTPDPTKVLLMNPGDELRVTLRDTLTGLNVFIEDLTTHTTGTMTASIANGFGQVVFEPTASTCRVQPYAFHPMYSTSSEHTRVSWAAHSYNIAFSDEIGHFEYCPDGNFVPLFGDVGYCAVNPPANLFERDGDDFPCWKSTSSSLVKIGGCIGTDTDFDGVPYLTAWPGTLTNTALDAALHAQPVKFSSPRFFTREEDDTELADYDRVAFETDLPRIESTCNRGTGVGCVNPPTGKFYPIFTTGSKGEDGEGCVWQLGGAHIPGTTNTFGGTSTAEYGALLPLLYATPTGSTTRINDFRKVLGTNPCKVDE